MTLLRTVTRALSARRRPTVPEPAPASVGSYACQDIAACLPDVGPLTTELLAAAQHTRQLPWLAARESNADAYRLAARRLLLDIDAGYRAVTRGNGTLEDLVDGLVPPVKQVDNDDPRHGHAA